MTSNKSFGAFRPCSQRKEGNIQKAHCPSNMFAQDYRPQQNIYSCEPKEGIKIEKPPRYVSKFRPTVLVEEKLPKQPKRTMGVAKLERPTPENYLKKHPKEPKLPEKAQNAREGRINPLRKPPVPRRTEIPPLNIPSKRDITKPIPLVTKKPTPITVNTHKGHKEVLENSGRVPKHILKKDYGEVPVYLQRRNAEKQKAQQEYEKLMKEQKEKEALKKLSEEERQRILQGLKKNWDKLHKQYQGLSFITDNFTKFNRKARLEVAMDDLEKEIKRMEKFKHIYIIDD